MDTECKCPLCNTDWTVREHLHCRDAPDWCNSSLDDTYNNNVRCNTPRGDFEDNALLREILGIKSAGSKVAVDACLLNFY